MSEKTKEIIKKTNINSHQFKKTLALKILLVFGLFILLMTTISVLELTKHPVASATAANRGTTPPTTSTPAPVQPPPTSSCLLYTSDAADE